MPALPRFDVEEWLAQLGLSAYAQAFKDNDIDAAVLRTLTQDDLREMGVVSVGHRRRILDAASRLGESAEAPPAESPAAAPAGERRSAERRMLTIMFCDLVDSTALSVGTDPEDYREFIASFRLALEAAIRPFDGYVAQYAGDGVMAYFGYPQSSDHDAEKGVSAGLAAVETVKRMAPFGGHVPRVRIGIATGLTVVGAVDRSREFMGESAVGEAPNLAARLQAMAAPNAVVVAAATRQLIGGVFECEDLGAFALKGFDRPVRAWQVLRRASATSRFDALRTGRRAFGFIGREPEMARLGESLAAARAGRGQFAVISGEAGLGKSRLALRVLEEAGQTAAGSVILQCSPYHVGSPLHPLRYYIERASGIGAGESAQENLPKLSAYLHGFGGVTPERLALIAELLRIEGADARPLQGLTQHERRARTMRHLAAVLEAAARASPVIVIEDVQWLDPSTAELVEGLVPTLRLMPVLLIATARPGPFPSFLAKAEAELIRLKPLPLADVRALVRAIGEGELSEEAAEAIAARADGIPIFAEELTRGYIESAPRGEAADELSRIPATLAETILARLDRLAHGRKIVSIAAAIGREFPVALLIAVAGLPEDEARAGIRELLDADVMTPGHSPFGEAISFRHMLLRDAAYGLLLRRNRAALHARIADTLATKFPAIAEALPNVMAIQRAQAGMFEEAAKEWMRAGQAAARRSAYSEAVDHFSKAADAIAQRPAGVERDESELACRLELMGALIAARGFAAEGVTAEMEQIVSLSRTLGTTAKLVPALHSKWVVLLTSGAVRAARELAFQARDAAAQGSEIDRLLAHRMCGTALLFSAEFEAAIDEYERFMALYLPEKHAAELRTGHSDHATMVLMGLAEAHLLRAEFELAERWRQRTIATVRETARLHDLGHVLVFAGCLHPALTGRFEETERFAAELNDLVAGHDLLFWRGHADLFCGLALIRRGEKEEGFAQARRGVQRLIEASAFSNGWYILYAQACLESGYLDEAADVLALVRPSLQQGDARFASEFHRVDAMLARARGAGVEEARARLQEALALALSQGAHLFVDRIRRELDALPACDPGRDPVVATAGSG